MLDFQSLLQTLATSGVPVVIVAVGVPAPTLAQMATPQGMGQVTTATVPMTVPGTTAATAPESATAAAATPMPARETPLQRLRADEQRNGRQKRQAREWGKLLKVSARELERAVKAGAIEYAVQQFGRGHGARLIKTADLRTYLETVAAVAAGRMDAPAWYARVRPTP